MHPARPALPELHGVGLDPEPTPLVGHRHVVGVRRVRGRPGVVELLAASRPRATGATRRRPAGRRAVGCGSTPRPRRGRSATAVPSTRTCRSSGCQGNSSAQRGLAASSTPLREPRLVKKTQPLRTEALEQHHPRRRLPVGVDTDATTIAFGSCTAGRHRVVVPPLEHRDRVRRQVGLGRARRGRTRGAGRRTVITSIQPRPLESIGSRRTGQPGRVPAYTGQAESTGGSTRTKESHEREPVVHEDSRASSRSRPRSPSRTRRAPPSATAASTSRSSSAACRSRRSGAC